MCRRHFRLPHFAFRLPHFAFRLSPSAFRLPHSAFRRNAVPCREDRECYPSVLCSDGCVATLLVLRTIQVKQIPCAANKRSAVERHYKKGALPPPVFDGSPLPPFMRLVARQKQTPPDARGTFPRAHKKAERQKKGAERDGKSPGNQSFFPAREWMLRLIIS